jgi:hypothetical protein
MNFNIMNKEQVMRPQPRQVDNCLCTQKWFKNLFDPSPRRREGRWSHYDFIDIFAEIILVTLIFKKNGNSSPN